MSGKNIPKLRLTRPQLRGDRNSQRFERPDYVRVLLAAGAHASTLGIALLDSQTRFQSVNTALAAETRLPLDQHMGKTSREIVGELAKQIEPTYEKVFRTGKPASVWTGGNVRDTQETGYWFNYCFPILDKSQRVQQLGLFVVNVTAERASTEIFRALATDSKFLRAQASGIIEKFDESIRGYHSSLRTALKAFACASTDDARKVDGFRSSLERLDSDIRLMRELIYAVIDEFSIAKC